MALANHAKTENSSNNTCNNYLNQLLLATLLAVGAIGPQEGRVFSRPGRPSRSSLRFDAMKFPIGLGPKPVTCRLQEAVALAATVINFFVIFLVAVVVVTVVKIGSEHSLPLKTQMLAVSLLGLVGVPMIALPLSLTSWCSAGPFQLHRSSQQQEASCFSVRQSVSRRSRFACFR